MGFGGLMDWIVEGGSYPWDFKAWYSECSCLRWRCYPVRRGRGAVSGQRRGFMLCMRLSVGSSGCFKRRMQRELLERTRFQIWDRIKSQFRRSPHCTCKCNQLFSGDQRMEEKKKRFEMSFSAKYSVDKNKSQKWGKIEGPKMKEY